MSSFTFDDFDKDQVKYQRLQKPIWALGVDDPQNSKQILTWLNAEINYLQKESEQRLREIRKHVALYKGIQYESQEVNRQSLRDNVEDRARVFKKIVVNHLYDLTENKVAKLVKYRPAVAVMPTNDEFQDKVSSKMVKMLLDHIWYEQDFDSVVVPEIVKDTFIGGECYLWITWNKDKGDLHPDFDPEKKEPVLDDNGQPMKDDAGNVIYIEQPVYVGDVQYDIVMADEVYLQPKRRFSDVEYCFKRNIKNVDELRLEYPKMATKIKPSKDYEFYDYDKCQMVKLENEVVVWEFFHKYSKGLPKGRQVVFTPDVILENIELPYNHGELPCERLTDIDVPGEVYAKSFYINIKGLTASYNNLTNMALRNEYLVSHPKWMMPAGSANIDQLGNDITIVQFKGPQPPILVQANPTSPQTFAFRQEIKEDFQQLSAVYGVSRGEPPPGIKAGIALQFLSEQESERYNSAILKFNEFIRKVAVKTISVASDYYDPTDQRMIRVIGKNNEWMTEFFDAATLSKDYDIRIQNSSALPQSKAARAQYLLDIKKEYPTLIPDEQFVDMLDLAQNEKFVDIAAVSVRTAEAEIENLLQGKPAAAPEEYEDLITKWKVYAKTPQEYSFKTSLPKEIRDTFLDHLAAIEMLMLEKAKKNDTFAGKLAEIANFPLIFEPIPQEEPMSPPPTPAPMQDVAQPMMGNADMMPLPVNPGSNPISPPQLVNEPQPPIEGQLDRELVSAPIEPSSGV